MIVLEGHDQPASLSRNNMDLGRFKSTHIDGELGKISSLLMHL